jgi:hypothetical protein
LWLTINTAALWSNLHMLCFCAPQAQPIPAQLEFERITQRRRAQSSNPGARRHPHFEQSPADFIVVRDSSDTSRFADGQIGR